MASKKLLFLAIGPLHPPRSGGDLRTLNILRGVAAHYDVTLVALGDSPPDASALAYLESLCDAAHFVPNPAPRRRTLVDKISGIAARYPAALGYFESAEMRHLLYQLRRQQTFALVHIDHIGLAIYRDMFAGCPIVLTHHNVEAVVQGRFLRLSPAPWRLGWWGHQLEQRRWHRLETDASRDVDAVVVVSEPERAFFARHVPETPVFLAPNGVDTTEYSPLPQVEAPVMLFTGKMDYAPNVDAVVWFCAKIWPLIRKARPDARFLIVGRHPTPKVRSLADLPGVTVTGTVPEVRPYFAQAAVFVVPLRFGGGTRLKIVEAAALQRAIVSTTLGNEGLHFRPDEHLLLADDPERFGAAVLRLLHNPDERDRLARNARELVEQQYDWDNIVPRQLAAYAAALQKHA